MSLVLKDIEKTYQDGDRQITVIQNLNFTFPTSGLIAISGQSGVGKSTLLQLLGGLDKPTKGSIFIDDTDITKLQGDSLSNLRGQKIGFVFQFHHLLPEFSAVENVAMPLIIAGQEKDIALSKAHNLLVRVGLEDRTQNRPFALSGGEQQRVAVARALIFSPYLVLLDEPTGNLDHSNAENLKQLLFELNRELNNLMIVVTHSTDLANSLDYHFKMNAGGSFETIK